MTGTMFLIGESIQHSLSPPTWNRVFTELGVDMRYGLRDVDAAGLAEVAAELRSGSVIAANVTMPHKEWAAAQSDIATAEVAATGVANFLQLRQGELFAANTDVVGARQILSHADPIERPLVLGAGGTSRALLAALAAPHVCLTIANRTRARAEALADTWRSRFATITVVDWTDRVGHVAGADLVVNTTPVDRADPVSPLPTGTLSPSTRLYDVIYASEPTPLQRQAIEAGVALVDGLTHLGAQAVAMLELLGFPTDAANLVEASLAAAAGRPIPLWDHPPSEEARSWKRS